MAEEEKQEIALKSALKSGGVREVLRRCAIIQASLEKSARVNPPMDLSGGLSPDTAEHGVAAFLASDSGVLPSLGGAADGIGDGLESGAAVYGQVPVLPGQVSKVASRLALPRMRRARQKAVRRGLLVLVDLILLKILDMRFFYKESVLGIRMSMRIWIGPGTGC